MGQQSTPSQIQFKDIKKKQGGLQLLYSDFCTGWHRPFWLNVFESELSIFLPWDSAPINKEYFDTFPTIFTANLEFLSKNYNMRNHITTAILPVADDTTLTHGSWPMLPFSPTQQAHCPGKKRTTERWSWEVFTKEGHFAKEWWWYTWPCSV